MASLSFAIFLVVEKLRETSFHPLLIGTLNSVLFFKLGMKWDTVRKRGIVIIQERERKLTVPKCVLVVMFCTFIFPFRSQPLNGPHGFLLLPICNLKILVWVTRLKRMFHYCKRDCRLVRGHLEAVIVLPFALAKVRSAKFSWWSFQCTELNVSLAADQTAVKGPVIQKLIIPTSNHSFF